MEATLTAVESSFVRAEVRPQEDELEESTSRQKEARTNTVRWSWLHVLVMSVALLGLCILMGIVMDNMRSSGRDGAEARLALQPARISVRHSFH